jgi:glutamine amidotransferase
VIVVDCGHGNIFSICRALEIAGVEADVVVDADRVRDADGIILPGVGAFSSVMRGLQRNSLHEAVVDAVQSDIPVLGICVGMQVLFDQSMEFGQQTGLGLIPGTVNRLPDGKALGEERQRIPNVGWRPLRLTGEDPLTAGFGEDEMMYFVHSFAPSGVPPENVLATIEFNGENIPIMVRKGNLYGCQFHPERSAERGIDLIRRFAEIVARRNR